LVTSQIQTEVQAPVGHMLGFFNWEETNVKLTSS
jgi:hypothetical protein